MHLQAPKGNFLSQEIRKFLIVLLTIESSTIRCMQCEAITVRLMHPILFVSVQVFCCTIAPKADLVDEIRLHL